MAAPQMRLASCSAVGVQPGDANAQAASRVRMVAGFLK